MYKKIILPIALISLSMCAEAQSMYPHIDFETTNTTPLTKNFSSLDTVITNTIKWVMPGVRLGDAETGDYKIGNRSARIGKLNGNTGENGCMTMVQDLPNGLHDLNFKGAMFGNDTGGRLEFAMSTNSGATWIITDTFLMPPNNAPENFNVHHHQNGNVRFRLCKIDAGTGYINVDSISIEEMGVPPATYDIMSFTPYHQQTVVAANTSRLVVDLNQFGDPNVGDIELHKIGGATQTFDVATSPNVSMQGYSLVIDNVTLEPNSTYYITTPSGLLLSDFGSMPMPAIDSGDWVFHTTRSHYDSFTVAKGGCNSVDSLDGVFKVASISGTDTWACTTDGQLGVYKMSVNAVNNNYPANEDWLISLYPILTTPNATLTFDEAKEGFGTSSTRGLYYTTRFAGQVNTTPWTQLADLGAFSANNQYQTQTLQLGNMNLPDTIYIAFKYTSTSNANNAPYTWKLSNIKYNSNQTTSIKNFDKNITNKLRFVNSQNHDLKIIAQVVQQSDFQFEMYDINGRLVKKWSKTLNEGNSLLNTNVNDLNSGIYMVIMRNHNTFETLKVIIGE